MLVVVAAIIALQLAPAAEPIGVAVPTRDGQFCVAMPAPALAPARLSP